MANILSRTKTAFQILFGNRKMKQLQGYFSMLDGYVPTFTSYDGGVYEMELTRACIHAFANHCSKLQPNVTGADLSGFKRILENKPNPFMTSAQFLYKVATIHEAQNTCFVLPVLDKYDNTVGFYPAAPQQVDIVNAEGSNEPWLRYTFNNGTRAAIELNRCGVVSKYLYKNDVFGEDNRALNPTMQLIDLQNQGIAEGIKNGASFRFAANASNFAADGDLKAERQRFVADNFGPGSGGLILFPNTYTNVQQVHSSPQIVDSTQMTIVQERVYNYFGASTEILQNKAVGDTWAAYYEGKIEPFAIQLSQALTCMAYSPEERSRGNAIMFSANRLQYMTNTDKLAMSSQMFDRGVLSLNDIMDVWNLPHVDGGDKRYIRKEYTEIEQLNAAALAQPVVEPQNGGNNDPSE